MKTPRQKPTMCGIQKGVLPLNLRRKKVGIPSFQLIFYLVKKKLQDLQDSFRPFLHVSAILVSSY